MVKHLAVVSLLGHDFMALLVEDISEPVESLVEPAADDAAFVESEVKFLVFQGIQHIRDLLPHLSGCQNGCGYGCHGDDDREGKNVVA